MGHSARLHTSTYNLRLNRPFYRLQTCLHSRLFLRASMSQKQR